MDLSLFLCTFFGLTLSTDQILNKYNQECPSDILYNLAVRSNQECEGYNGKGIYILIKNSKIGVCFDPINHQTIWTEHVLEKVSSDCSTSNQTKWESDFFLDLNLDLLYRSVLAHGLQPVHLAPVCDFGSTKQRDATNFYLNSAPMVTDLHLEWEHAEEELRNSSKFGRSQKYTIRTVPYGTQCLIQGRLNVPTHFIKDVSGLSTDYTYIVGDNSLSFTEPTIIWPCQQSRCKKISNNYRRVYCCEGLVN